MHRLTNKQKKGDMLNQTKENTDTKNLVTDQSIAIIDAVAECMGLVDCCVKISAVISCSEKKNI